jgi:hypothetical protein
MTAPVLLPVTVAGIARATVQQAAIGMLAFMLACIAHEAVGHGGLCVALGGHITLLTSVYFRCSQPHSLVDAAGPGMNLVVGIACWAVLATRAPRSAQWRLFVVLAMAFNLFWGTGYFMYSAATGEGDWSFLLHESVLLPAWALRLAMGAFGACLYSASMRLVGAKVPPGTSTATVWLAGGLTSCLAVLFFRGAVPPALSQAAWESFGAAAGLLLLGRRASASAAITLPAIFDGRGYAWPLAAIVVLVGFVASLGRGLP